MKIVINGKFKAIARHKDTGWLSYESAVDTIENIMKTGGYKYHASNPKFDVKFHFISN